VLPACATEWRSLARCATLAAAMHKLQAAPILSSVLFVISLSAAVSCSRKVPEPEPVSAPPAALTTSEPAQPAASTPPLPAAKPPGPSEDFVGYPKEGWSKLKLQDTLPLCVFSNAQERENAKVVEQAKKQQLKANQSVVFGAFGPYCINPQCDDLPTLQCSVKRDGSTLTVRANYIGYHKDGTTCSEDCGEVIAGCETPSLEPGKYTIQYGDNSYALKIPSTLKSPCFKKE
jgi:hypothetical protein